MPPPPAVIPPGEIREQVILPAAVAFGICLRGIKARLGRSLITLSGVSLGIAFFMAVMYGQHIKLAMAAHAERLREVDRRVAAVRSEVGLLREKNILILAGRASEEDRAFAAALVQQHGVRVMLWGGLADEDQGPTGTMPTAAMEPAAVIALGAAPWPQPVEIVAQWRKPVIAFEAPPTAIAEALAKSGAEVKIISWESRPEDKEREARREAERRARMEWLIAVSLGITLIGIANAMLMSVTERFREIGTMKCLGALSSFVVKLFLIESALVGLVGSICGAVAGAIFAILAYAWSYGLAPVISSISYAALASMAGQCLIGGMALAVMAGIYPAWLASKMIPAAALSSHV